MKRYNVLLRLTTCLALGGTLTTLWICAVIGFGLHTTVGKEALYLWLVLQALQLSAAALRLRRGGVVLAGVIMGTLSLLGVSVLGSIG